MDKLTNLKKWLGIDDSTDYIEMVTDNYRKVIAKKDIRKGTLIMAISDDKIIGDEMVSTIPNYEFCKTRVASNNSLVAMYMLLNEHNPRWSPYYDILPSDLSNFWYYLSNNIKDMIKNTELGKEIDRYYKNKFENDVKLLKSCFPMLNNQENLNKWFKYRILVNSRIFGYTRNNIPTSGMVPLADMLNHNIRNNCDWTYDNTTKKFIMRSNQDISRGSELLDSYGVKENIRYYLLYGFVPESISQNNDCELHIDDYVITSKTTLEELLKNYNFDKQSIFTILLIKLKEIPTVKMLEKCKCGKDIILLLNNEKNILKNLLSKLVEH